MIAHPPPVLVHTQRAALEAKLDRIAREWAELPDEPTPDARGRVRHRPAVLEVPIGSAPWGVTLRVEPPIKGKGPLADRASAALQAELAAWLKTWPPELCTGAP